MVADPTYFSKLGHFDRLYRDRVATAAALLKSDPEAVREIQKSQVIVTAAIEELVGLYRELYIDANSAQSKDAVLRLTRLEANIAMSVAQTLDATRKLLTLRSGGAGRLISPLRSRLLRHGIRKINASLDRRDDAAPLSAAVAVREMLLAGRKPVKTAFLVIALIALHRPMSDWPRWLDPSNFFRADDLAFPGVDEAKATMAGHPRRVMVLIGNHDASLYDIPIANRTARLLGSGHHIIMTRKGVYPIPPPESAGDVVYVDEEDPNSYPVAESVARVKESAAKHDVVSIAVYPEGMMPFNGAQMPLIAKEGAYVVARKIAVELDREGVPVFLVETKTNAIAHLTSTEFIPPEVRIAGVEVVPTEPMVKGRPDDWIARRRLQSQNLYNEDRGERMIDIAAITRIPDSITFEASGEASHADAARPRRYDRRPLRSARFPR